MQSLCCWWWLLLAMPALCQSTCPGFGSWPRPATAEAAPFPLSCAAAPAWHLFTPAHREPAWRPGFTPGAARELPRWLVTYRCTGLWFLPLIADRPRAMGYVIDQPAERCSGPITP